MAESGSSTTDCFYPGSIVKCTNCYNKEEQGEVMTFDSKTRILLLKKASSCGKPDLNDLSVVNVNFLKDIKIIKETEPTTLNLPALNASKLKNRYKEAVDQKRVLCNARSDGVSEIGVELYNHLKKVFPVKSIVFREQDIQVMEDVLVKPPYRNDNCVPTDPKKPEKQCLNHVKNVVERFHKEERSKAQSQEST